MNRIDILAAGVMASAAHAGQTDSCGESYIIHPFWVATELHKQGASDFTVVAGILHDVVEDSPVTLDRICDSFGSTVASAVDALTHRKGERNIEYYQRILRNPIALEVKLVDIAHNMSEERLAALPEKVQLRLRAKYERALDVLQGGVTC